MSSSTTASRIRFVHPVQPRHLAVVLYFVLALVGAGLGSAFLGALVFLGSTSELAASSAALGLFAVAGWRIRVAAGYALRKAHRSSCPGAAPTLVARL